MEGLLGGMGDGRAAGWVGGHVAQSGGPGGPRPCSVMGPWYSYLMRVVVLGLVVQNSLGGRPRKFLRLPSALTLWELLL